MTHVHFTGAPITGEVITLTITTTAARFAIPAGFAGVECEFICEGADADVAWGDSSVAVTYGAAATVSGEAITTNAASGVRLQDGISAFYVMPSSRRATHLSAVAASGTPLLTIARRAGP